LQVFVAKKLFILYFIALERIFYRNVTGFCNFFE